MLVTHVRCKHFLFKSMQGNSQASFCLSCQSCYQYCFCRNETYKNLIFENNCTILRIFYGSLLHSNTFFKSSIALKIFYSAGTHTLKGKYSSPSPILSRNKKCLGLINCVLNAMILYRIQPPTVGVNQRHNR